MQNFQTLLQLYRLLQKTPNESKPNKQKVNAQIFNPSHQEKQLQRPNGDVLPATKVQLQREIVEIYGIYKEISAAYSVLRF